MHDIAEFLRRHPPFDDVPEQALEELARSAEVEFFAAGATIFRQQDEPRKHVWIVRRGAVELIDQGRVLDLLGEGELFGHPSMLSGRPTVFETRAAEDTLCYRLPAEAVVPLLARPAGLRYVARSLLARRDARGEGGLDPTQQPVATLVNGEPIIVAPDDTIRETAQRMAAAGASAALVRLADGQLGIVTDGDLRDRVVAGGIGTETPVADVMSAPAFSVSPQRFGGEVMLEMLDRNVRHVPVVWPHGAVLGVLNDRDLLVAETRTPFALRRAIADAENASQLRRATSRLRPAVVAMHDAGLPAPQIAAMIAVVADALTRRLLELAVRDVGAAPCPFAWLALGSLGRREAVPSSDFDSALVWDGAEDDSEQRRYMEDLSRRVVDELASNGFAADPHGATAAHPLFDRSFASWRTLVRETVEHPDRDKALVFLSLLFDGRVMYEFGQGRDPLEELRQVWHRRTLLRLMLRLALAHKPPTGFLGLHDPGRDLGVERSGEHAGRLDIKEAGLVPIVAVARYAGMAAGVRALSTPERLEAAATAGTLQGADARTLNEAHDFFWQVRLDHQVEQLRNGRDDYVDPESLDASTRRFARDAFRAVSDVQRSLRGELTFPR